MNTRCYFLVLEKDKSEIVFLSWEVSHKEKSQLEDVMSARVKCCVRSIIL